MFETERLVLRPFEENDFKNLKHGLNEVSYLRNSTSRALAPLGDEFVKSLMEPRKSHQLPKFAVCIKPEIYTSEFVIGDKYTPLPMAGVIAFQNDKFDFKNRGCNLGIGFHDPKDRGKGYGTEVLTWALDYGFLELGLHKIGLECYSYNETAIKLYQKIGFVQEGRLRETALSRGTWYDTVIFGILQREWDAAKAKAT